MVVDSEEETEVVAAAEVVEEALDSHHRALLSRLSRLLRFHTLAKERSLRCARIKVFHFWRV